MKIPTSFSTLLKGEGLKARTLRGTMMTFAQVGGSNFFRLLSNLILTRLLFPEAFGLMALIQVFIYGLRTFSDIGIHTMLIQSKREDESFLNTLWTLQILRGGVLWLFACLIAVPVSRIYDQPMLAQLLPVAAFALVVSGFKTTREAQAMRAIKLERIVLLQLSTQFAGVVAIVLLAWWLRSVWALAIGSVITSLIGVVVMHAYLPGKANRLCWEAQAVRDTLRFGSFLFLSSIATFFNNMGAQMILGAYVPIALFGIYNIARQLGTLPGSLSLAVARNVIFPLYRISPPKEGAENQANVFRARRLVSLFAIGVTACLALVGDWIVDLLFDPRYELAGSMLILLALSLMPIYGYVGVQESLSGSGDSKRHFYLSLVKGLTQVLVLILLVPTGGIPAAILGPTIASLCIYPYQAWLIHQHKAWDVKGEIGLICFGILVAACIAWIKWDALRPVFDLPASFSGV